MNILRWGPYGSLVAALIFAVALAACDGTIPGSSSNSVNTTNEYTTNIFIDYDINTSGAGSDDGYVDMKITQKDNLNFLIEWETLGVFASAVPYLTYDFYIDGNVEVSGLKGGMFLWTAPNESNSYILKVCIADMSMAFCSNGALVEITAVEEPEEE